MFLIEILDFAAILAIVPLVTKAKFLEGIRPSRTFMSQKLAKSKNRVIFLIYLTVLLVFVKRTQLFDYLLQAAHDELFDDDSKQAGKIDTALDKASFTSMIPAYLFSVKVFCINQVHYRMRQVLLVTCFLVVYIAVDWQVYGTVSTPVIKVSERSE